MAPARNGEIELGGRAFRAVARSTIRHDHWLMARMRRAGFGELAKLPDEGARVYAERLMAHLLLTDGALELYGGLLVPAELTDRQWTPEVAAETATFIGGLDSPEDHAQVRTLLLMLLIPFFERELDSSAGIEPSSGPEHPAPDDPREFAHAAASGAQSFENSRGTAPTAH